MEPYFTEDEKRAGSAAIWLLFGAAGVIALFILWTTYLQYALGYVTQPARLTNAQRVESMSARMNNEWMALQAAERTIARDQEAVDAFEKNYGTDRSTWPQGKREEFEQAKANLRNSVAAYNSACGRYMAVYRDEYREIAAPEDLPTDCIMR